MSGHHHSKGPFSPPDLDDPLTGLGFAMVGMALQEAAEEEERQRRARLTPWQRAAEDRRNKELADKAWSIAGLVFVVGMLLVCLFLFVLRSAGS